VARHVDLVYSAARRRVGDAHLAEDVTQAVFLTLTRKARSIGSGVVIAGWLFNATRLIANNAVKARQRRERRERVARETMPAATNPTNCGDDWTALAPHLESAMDRLGRGERDAVLLRFYKGMSFKEVAAAIGISEDAATQRVSRAVAKLRAYFTGRGVNTTAEALTMGVAAHAVVAAPAAIKAAAAISAGGATATSLANGAVQAMAIANVKIAAAITAVVILSGAAGVATYHAAVAASPAPSVAARPAAAATVNQPATTTTSAPTSQPIGPVVQAQLDRKLPELNFQQIGAGDAVDFLRDITGANIFVAWQRLPARRPATSARNIPITLQIRNVSFDAALKALTEQMGDAVAYAVIDDVIRIDTRDALAAAQRAQERRAAPRWPAAAEARMDRRLPEVRFDAVALRDVIDFPAQRDGCQDRRELARVASGGREAGQSRHASRP
jgi:RNA polymerase sigma factor (sigma-70 family)